MCGSIFFQEHRAANTFLFSDQNELEMGLCKSDNDHLQMKIITEELWLGGTAASRAGLTLKSDQAKGRCPSNFGLSSPNAEIPQSPLALSCSTISFLVYWVNSVHCCAKPFPSTQDVLCAGCWLLPFLETALPPSPSWASTRPNIPLQNVELRTKCDFSWCGYKEGPQDVSSLPGPVLAEAVKK